MKQKIIEMWESISEKIKSLFPYDEDGPIDSVMEYKNRIRRQKIKKWLKRGAIVIVVISVIIFIKYTIDHWSYSDYTIISNSMQEVTVSAKYTEYGENLLKYGGDEIALINRQEKVVWTYAETMNYPVVDVCGESCLVYDKKGTTFSIFNLSGKVGTIQTTLPILKAEITQQGVVAAILEDGDTTWINVYDTDGDLIVTSKTRMESPGYPLDISISSNGLLMAVSYVRVENNKLSNNVTFYNFGNTGQNMMDNVVNSYSYGDILIPDVEYVNDVWAIAFSENGFYTYKGQRIPEEQEKVTVDSEIMSVFYDQAHVGLIVRNNDPNASYRMELYDFYGNKKSEALLNSLYDTIKVSQNEILLYNKTNFAVYSMKGVCRYQGAIKEGAMHELFKIARNRYTAVLESGLETFKLVN